jgi:hypothetical protein
VNTTGVSSQSERRPIIERGLRVPREHRRGMAESEECECHSLIGATSTRREKPGRVWR